MNDQTDPDVIVVGAGFAGLYAIYKFRRQGLRVKVFEAGTDVGGTWYWNRYPGARCDVPSLEYSFGFSEELEQEWEWPEVFSAQSDILRYANHIADKFDLRRDIEFNTRVTAATFDEHAALWRITTDQGKTHSAPFCVMATGCLSVPNKPELPGADSFAGLELHTGTWPREPVDLSGKRVASSAPARPACRPFRNSRDRPSSCTYSSARRFIPYPRIAKPCATKCNRNSKTTTARFVECSRKTLVVCLASDR